MENLLFVKNRIQTCIENYAFEIFFVMIIVSLIVMWFLRPYFQKNSVEKSVEITKPLEYNNSKPIKSKAFNGPNNSTVSNRNFQSKGEIETRRVLELLFNKPFPNKRLIELTNPVTGKPLELDCYNEELKLAVEYNGKQHYENVNKFHKTPESLHNQKYRDYIKRNLCEKNGILLIEIPYTVKIENIQTYLIENLMNSLSVYENISTEIVDINQY